MTPAEGRPMRAVYVYHTRKTLLGNKNPVDYALPPEPRWQQAALCDRFSLESLTKMRSYISYNICDASENCVNKFAFIIHAVSFFSIFDERVIVR